MHWALSFFIVLLLYKGTPLVRKVTLTVLVVFLVWFCLVIAQFGAFEVFFQGVWMFVSNVGLLVWQLTKVILPW